MRAFGFQESFIVDKLILIVDDEERARSRLARLLHEINPHLKIEMAKNGIEALEKIKSLYPGIVFLDIEMPGMTGLEVLNQLPERNFKIIFQTAYDEYALKAFEENACDYLLKPIEKERLETALLKAIRMKEFEGRLLGLEIRFAERGHFLENICIKKGNRMMSLNVKDIDCFRSQDHYTFVHAGTEEHIIDLPLSHLESRLNPNSFFRCHRSHIINLEKVDSLSLGPTMKVNLLNNLQVPVSRQSRHSMKSKMTSK